MTRVAIVLKAVRWLNKLPRREPSMVSFIQRIWSTMSCWLKYGSQQFVGGIVHPCVSPMFYIEYIISMYIYMFIHALKAHMGSQFTSHDISVMESCKNRQVAMAMKHLLQMMWT